MIKIIRKIAYVALCLYMVLSPSLQATQSNTAKPDPDTFHYAKHYLIKALNLPDISYIVVDYISHEDPYAINFLDLMIKLEYNAHAQRMIGKVDKETLLLKSAQKGLLACVKYLVQQKAYINTTAKDGTTALMWSAEQGHLACVKYLVAQGADIDVKDKDEKTALIWSAVHGHLACVKYLVAQGADINAENQDGCTALTFSAGQGYLDCANYLRQQGAK